jgi:hypothetical protein
LHQAAAFALSRSAQAAAAFWQAVESMEENLLPDWDNAPPAVAARRNWGCNEQKSVVDGLKVEIYIFTVMHFTALNI